MPNDTQISKFMSLVLRHAPQEAGLSLDENGWADLGALCAVIQAKFSASAIDVQRIVDENPKKRFAIDGNRIRAVQGHSVDIDLGLAPSVPPAILYHGTKEEFLPSILHDGLTSQSRQHVHLSKGPASWRGGAREKMLSFRSTRRPWLETVRHSFSPTTASG